MRLKLVLSDRDDPQLLETDFEYQGGKQEVRRKAKRGSDAGCFGWTRGVQAMTVFLLKWAAWGRYCAAHPDVAPPDIQGRRRTLAATLNDVLTKKPQWLTDIFGNDAGGNPRVEFIRRTNPDFKTVPNAPVRLSLDCDQLPPLRIEVLLSDEWIEDPETLNALADRIAAKYLREDTRGGPLALTDAPSAAIDHGDVDTAASGVQALRLLGDSPVQASCDLADEVLRYLRDLAEDCARLPYYFPPHLKNDGPGKTAFDSIRQTVRVVEDRRAFEEWLAKERERLRRAGFDTDRLDYGPSRGMPDEDGETGYHGASMETIPWDGRAGRRFHRATILGDPGFGKTWLLRYEAGRLAREAIERLTSAMASVDDIDLPVLMRLPDLAARDDALEEAIVTLLGQDHSSDFRDYLRGQLTSNHGIVLLDAWDEVSDLDRRRRLKERIHAFVRRYPARILLTSRIVGYDLTQPPLPEGKELGLLAWKWRQIGCVVGVWFGSDTHRAKRFLNKLKQHPQFRGLARIPLMLQLLCQACPDGDLPARRSDLYRDCLWGLLRDWHIHDKDHVTKYTKIQLSNTYIDGLIEVLEHLSLELQEKGPQQFREDYVCPAIESFLNELYRGRPSHELRKEQVSRADLMERFKNDGVLITATGVGRELQFLHLTFQEYLAARALAKRSDCIEEALRHIYDPAWHQVLVMLGGAIERPGPYIAALLRKNKEDLLCRPFLLAIQAAAEASRDGLPKQLFSCLAEEAINIRFEKTLSFLSGRVMHAARELPESAECLIAELEGGRSTDRSKVIRALGEVGSLLAVPILMKILQDEDASARWIAAWALGAIGSEQAVPALVETLQDEASEVQGKSAWALGQIGSTKAVPALIGALRERHDQVCWEASEALGKIGSTEAVPALVKALRGAETTVKVIAAMTLGEIGSAEAVPALTQSLWDGDAGVRSDAALALRKIAFEQTLTMLIEALQDGNVDVRWAAAAALGRIRSMKAVPALIEALRDGDAIVRWVAAEALGKIGSADAVPALINALRDGNASVRGNAVEALGEIGSVDAVPVLIGSLRGEDAGMRFEAAEALGQIGSAEAVPALVEALRDDDAAIRWMPARALGQIGSVEAVPALIQTLGDEYFKMRWAAAAALGEIGSEKAVPGLTQAMQDKDAHVRQKAAEALGEIGSPEAVPALIQALRGEDVQMRETALEALGTIGSEQGVAALIEALQDEDTSTRLKAVDALGKIGSDQAADALIQSLWGEFSDQKAADILLGLFARASTSHIMHRVPEDIRRDLHSLAESLDRLADLCENP